jgi:hypothetical protein
MTPLLEVRILVGLAGVALAPAVHVEPGVLEPSAAALVPVDPAQRLCVVTFEPAEGFALLAAAQRVRRPDPLLERAAGKLAAVPRECVA